MRSAAHCLRQTRKQGAEQQVHSTPAAGADTENAVKETASSKPAEAPAADEARTVKHAMGETVLTGTPERVVVLTQEGTEAVLELGITPVGAVNSGLGDSWFPTLRITCRSNGAGR